GEGDGPLFRPAGCEDYPSRRLPTHGLILDRTRQQDWPHGRAGDSRAWEQISPASRRSPTVSSAIITPPSRISGTESANGPAAARCGSHRWVVAIAPGMTLRRHGPVRMLSSKRG